MDDCMIDGGFTCGCFGTMGVCVLLLIQKVFGGRFDGSDLLDLIPAESNRGYG